MSPYRGTFTSVWVVGTGFEVEVVDDRPGICLLEASGSPAKALFANEAGGHRWQGVSPTDKAGRVHTSTITVSVLESVVPLNLRIPDRDLNITVCRGSGAGGQNRNKRDTAVQIRHIPTGLTVRCEANRTQGQNKEMALALLTHRLKAQIEEDQTSSRQATKKNQVGRGARGDKRRTIREQHNEVVDHLTGKRWSFDKYVRGIW